VHAAQRDDDVPGVQILGQRDLGANRRVGLTRDAAELVLEERCLGVRREAEGLRDDDEIDVAAIELVVQFGLSCRSCSVTPGASCSTRWRTAGKTTVNT
jgi:hypothetical protein